MHYPLVSVHATVYAPRRVIRARILERWYVARGPRAGALIAVLGGRCAERGDQMEPVGGGNPMEQVRRLFRESWDLAALSWERHEEASRLLASIESLTERFGVRAELVDRLLLDVRARRDVAKDASEEVAGDA